jgi:hypothetical protein
MYHINLNHNFNQTYHDMIFGKKKSQTTILTKRVFYMNQPQQKWFFQNHFYQITTTIITIKTHSKRRRFFIVVVTVEITLKLVTMRPHYKNKILSWYLNLFIYLFGPYNFRYLRFYLKLHFCYAWIPDC